VEMNKKGSKTINIFLSIISLMRKDNKEEITPLSKPHEYKTST
jgi:hypothetical protein